MKYSPGELRTLPEDEWIDSRISIVQRENIGQSLAEVSGATVGTYVKDQETHTDTLLYMNVFFIPQNSTDTIKLYSDDDGLYKARLSPGKYNLHVDNPGFCKISAEGIVLEAGDRKRIDILMGQGRGTNRYIVNPEGTTEKVQDKRR